METSYVELQEIPVLRVRADMKGKGPSAAFNLLESKLPTIKGRKFYGTFQPGPDGEEYYACVARVDSDDPEKMQLEIGTIPGGWYARRRFPDWEQNLSKLPDTFEEMARAHDVDPTRPSIEFYRSQAELLLFLPVRTPLRTKRARQTSRSEYASTLETVLSDVHQRSHACQFPNTKFKSIALTS